MRKGDKPLQLSRRFSEIESVNKNFERIRSSKLYLENKHFDGLSLQINNIKGQYKMLRNSLYMIRCNDKRNNCCMLRKWRVYRSGKYYSM